MEQWYRPGWMRCIRFCENAFFDDYEIKTYVNFVQNEHKKSNSKDCF